MENVFKKPEIKNSLDMELNFKLNIFSRKKVYEF